MKPYVLLALLILPGCLFAQQVADPLFQPTLPHPEYQTGQGPVVFVDEGHHNFHTQNGRYQAFSKLLERDGYRVKAYPGSFRQDKLSEGKILVIANALNEINVQHWYLPNPSAFTKAEIEEVRQWVWEGGSLFLIADHMPMAGAAKGLGEAFGFEFTNGFVLNPQARGPAFFDIPSNTLTKSILTQGRRPEEKVERIATFTGQAFKIPDEATAILTFDKNYFNLLPDTAWVFDETTPQWNAAGWSQGAFRRYGAGRVVVFGEAAMFTAQVVGASQMKVGMNSELAPENYQLLLNIIHWLDGRLDK